MGGLRGGVQHVFLGASVLAIAATLGVCADCALRVHNRCWQVHDLHLLETALACMLAGTVGLVGRAVAHGAREDERSHGVLGYAFVATHLVAIAVGLTVLALLIRTV